MVVELFGVKAWYPITRYVCLHLAASTSGRVFRALNAEDFQRCFADWTAAICELSAGSIIAVDGKQLHGSQDSTLGRDGIYMVSVWASENELVVSCGLSLAKVVVNGNGEYPVRLLVVTLTGL